MTELHAMLQAVEGPDPFCRAVRYQLMLRNVLSIFVQFGNRADSQSFLQVLVKVDMVDLC